MKNRTNIISYKTVTVYIFNFTFSIHIVNAAVQIHRSTRFYDLTLYVAVTQFTYGKLRHCYVKS